MEALMDKTNVMEQILEAKIASPRASTEEHFPVQLTVPSIHPNVTSVEMEPRMVPKNVIRITLVPVPVQPKVMTAAISLAPTPAQSQPIHVTDVEIEI